MKIGNLPAGPSFREERPTGEVSQFGGEVHGGSDAPDQTTGWRGCDTGDSVHYQVEHRHHRGVPHALARVNTDAAPLPLASSVPSINLPPAHEY